MRHHYGPDDRHQTPAKPGKAWYVTEAGREWPGTASAVGVDPSADKITRRADFNDISLAAKLTRWTIAAQGALRPAQPAFAAGRRRGQASDGHGGLRHVVEAAPDQRQRLARPGSLCFLGSNLLLSSFIQING